MTQWLDRRKLWQIALIGSGAGLIGSLLGMFAALASGAPFHLVPAAALTVLVALQGALSLTAGMFLRRHWRRG